MIRSILALLVLHLLTSLPAAPSPLVLSAFAVPKLDMLILATAMILAKDGYLGRIIRIAGTVALGLVTILKCADLAMRESLGRNFNPVADLPLIDALVRLVAGTVGVWAAIGAVIAAILAGMTMLYALWWALGVLGRSGRYLAWSIGGLAVAILLLAPVTLPNWTFARDRGLLAASTITELRDFRVQARLDPMQQIPKPFSKIDRDVLVIFLESYGRTSFDTPFYAQRHLETLSQAQRRLSDAGLTMRSGFLTSPTHGGQSWLAHSTFMNGMTIGDQTRYQASIASGRQTLFHHAQRGGFYTAAIMPAITRAWPEGLTMGFDEIFADGDLGYQGLPFNWITMPDQFTLTALDRIRNAQPRPVFAEVALISSHAPWVPVPQMVDWDQVGDGTIFSDMAQAGDSPKEVWRDRDRVRSQYRDAIDYTLQAVMEYAGRQGRNAPLMVLVGDHQAATSIGLDDRRQVPIHIIGPAALVDLTADWGLTSGLIPPDDAAPLPMDQMRDNLLRSFSLPVDVPPA
ncbi:sulfatase-like hydrolase/transferase [Paracoccus sp. JM45]|uniref:sulfatase-like hydrolase/transferase n=1 Tax=Paracoccus sp. JM45 TaxID=2283626 RepID=UPI000E6BB4C3|nr:sulfatase-like hydrolase/transferase [Paracoccus sp. JM45]RJE80281.1 sulfatase [Paracoccus sp. JM45]